MSERCGIGRRYGCVDAEQPCGSRDSVLVNATGPRSGRLDASAASETGVACPSPLGGLVAGELKKIKLVTLKLLGIADFSSQQLLQMDRMTGY